MSISGLVAEYIVAIDVTRVRFPADAHEVKQGRIGSVLGGGLLAGCGPLACGEVSRVSKVCSGRLAKL